MKTFRASTVLIICIAAVGTAAVMSRFAAQAPQEQADSAEPPVPEEAEIAEPAAPAPGKLAQQPSAAPVPMPAMQEVQVIDAMGFGQPMVAATARIPAGWSTQGGFGWDRSSECVANHLRIQWLAASPDGEQAFEAMPGYNWQVQGTEIPMNPCPALAIRSTREFLQAIAQRYPNAQVIEYRERPELLPQNQAAPMNGARAHSDAGQLVIGYTSGGREMRAVLTTTLNFSELQGNVVVGVPAVYAQYAPKGRLNGMIGETIMQSMNMDQRWMAVATQTMKAAIDRIAQRQQRDIAAWHNRRMAEINARGAMDRAQIRMQTNREVAQIYSNIWASSMATDDRIHRRTLETIGGYNTYADPVGGGVVRSSIEYDRVIRTESGDYISTNDPYFNPAGSQELERIP